MEEVSLSELESQYYSDLFLFCDEEKTGKVPILKATELYRSANISNEKINEIISLAGIPSAVFHISRVQFYSCLKLIAAQQSSIPLRQELIAATITLPLPRFSWTDGSNSIDSKLYHHSGLTSIGDERNLLQCRVECSNAKSTTQVKSSQKNLTNLTTAGVLSTDSCVDQYELSYGDIGNRDGDVKRNTNFMKHSQCFGTGSPEAWSTNSDSPTPTNSIAERPWFKETLWLGLLGDEHKQLLGTEEESSDRHSSDEENDMDLNVVYQITEEQRDYYSKQFNAIQHDSKGLLSGQDAKVFFEKSRIPIEELRHIWQLCDVTRDGALNLAEFTAAMHLVVLRRNHMPLPVVLPRYLHPNVLQQQSFFTQVSKQEIPAADLLILGDDNDENNTVVNAIANTESISLAQNEHDESLKTLSTSSQVSITSGQCGLTAPDKQSGESQTISPKISPTQEQTITHSPPSQSIMISNSLNSSAKNKECSEWVTDTQVTQWTKFTESPTSNLSSPGPKPVNFDMQRTAQAVVSDPLILHPVPLRVTPVGGNISITTDSDKNYEDASNDGFVCDLSSRQFPVNSNSNSQVVTVFQRDCLQNNEFRAIQRPQAKKFLNKNAGALPPPPQREQSFTNNSNSCDCESNAYVYSSMFLNNKRDSPPKPPPRPYRHGRSSSLDLNKFKMIKSAERQVEKITQACCDLQSSLCFADFTQFANDDVNNGADLKHYNQQQQMQQAMHSLPHDTIACLKVSPIRSLSFQNNHSAFEVYRKPNSISPNVNTTTVHVLQCGAFGSAAAIAMTTNEPSIELSVKSKIQTVNQLRPPGEMLSKQDINKNETDLLHYLREQNNLLLSLCNDLNNELLTIQTQKKEIRLRIDALEMTISGDAEMQSMGTSAMRMGSSVSAPVTANVTGSSISSGVLSNI